MFGVVCYFPVWLELCVVSCFVFKALLDLVRCALLFVDCCLLFAVFLLVVVCRRLLIAVWCVLLLRLLFAADV